jgi:flagellar motor protein MotB
MTLSSRHGLRQDSGHGQARTLWLYTLSDLMSLLLCAFVLIFAMSQVEKGRWEQIFGVAVKDEAPMTAETRAGLSGRDLARGRRRAADDAG